MATEKIGRGFRYESAPDLLMDHDEIFGFSGRKRRFDLKTTLVEIMPGCALNALSVDQRGT